MECTVSQRGPARPALYECRVGGNGPVGDRAPESGVAVWIALRRSHEGGVANLAGQWLDSGRRVPGYVTDALDQLTSTGLLVLGEVDPEACGVRRVTVTDTGSARYVALCQIHNPNRRAAVRTPYRWPRCLPDQRSHLLAEPGPDQIGILVAVCGRRMPWSVGTSSQPTGCRCLACEALAAGPVPAPWFGNSPDSGRLLVEHSPNRSPLPAAGRTPQRRWDRPASLPATSVDPVSGPGLKLVSSLVLQRVHDGE